MRIITKRTLREFWEKNAGCRDAKGPLEAWFAMVSAADWRSPADIKLQFRHASFLEGNRVVFNIGGNKYRLIVKIHYPSQVVYIRFIGSHEQYDRINAESV